MNNKELALKYLPHFRKDKKEPFTVDGVGYTIYTETTKSVSSKLIVEVKNDVAFVIEYAIYFDYDIQHMYDLEHAFVYVDKDGKVIDVKVSFHGWFLNAYINNDLVFEEETHCVLYFQPGKHGIMCDPHYFYLYKELYEACMEKAASGGLLIPDMFKPYLSVTKEENKKIDRVMKEKYSFVPTMEFIPEEFNTVNLMTFTELMPVIVDRIKKCLEEI